MIHDSPLMEEILDDPYPIYKQLRDEAPVYYLEEFDDWVLRGRARLLGTTWKSSTAGRSPASMTSGSSRAMPIRTQIWDRSSGSDGLARPRAKPRVG